MKSPMGRYEVRHCATGFGVNVLTHTTRPFAAFNTQSHDWLRDTAGRIKTFGDRKTAERAAEAAEVYFDEEAS